MSGHPFNLNEQIEKVRSFVESYQEALRRLIADVPDDGFLLPFPIAAALGRCEIYTCRDGALVLTYDDTSDGSVIVVDSAEKTLSEFLKDGEPLAYFDETGAQVPGRIMFEPNSTGVPIGIKLSPDDFSFSSFSIDDLIMWSPEERPDFLDLDRTFFRPRFKRLSLYGWNAWLGDPKERARKDFRKGYMFRNSLQLIQEPSPSNRREAIFGATERCIDEFEGVLDDGNDDHIRNFIREHPEVIHPDYLRAYPAMVIDDKIQADIVLLVSGDSGPEWKVVKLGKVTDVFFESNDLSEPFVSAKAELLACADPSSRFQEIAPFETDSTAQIQYLYVMCRNTQLNYQQRRLLRAQNLTSNLQFCTYDDLVNRLRYEVNDVTEIRERYLPVEVRLERLNIRSDDDFNLVMEEVDQEMRDEAVPLPARSFEAVMRFSSEFGLSLVGKDPLTAKIIQWFSLRYGDRLKIDTDLGAMGVTVRADTYCMRFPLGYGLNRVVCSRALAKEKPSIIIGTNENPPTLNVLDFIDGLTQDYANSLTDEELEALFNQFVFGTTAFMRIDKVSRGDDLKSHARTDLNASTNHLFTNPPNYGHSKWASLQAAEKFIKAFITLKGGTPPRHHRLRDLAQLAKLHGLTEIPETWLDDIQCSAEVRYGGIAVTAQEAIYAQYSSLQVCEHVAIALEHQ